MRNALKLAAVLVGLGSGGANASPITAEFGGNVYQLIETSGLSLDDKITFSATQQWNGVPGHLLTITSAAENQFIYDSFGPRIRELGGGNGSSITIALSDRDVEGVFRWVDGPEVGQLPAYTNWVPGEPNNFNGVEDTVRMDFYTSGSYCCGRWNDSSSNWRFIVEFENTTLDQISVPEPTITALLALGLLGAGHARRRLQH